MRETPRLYTVLLENNYKSTNSLCTCDIINWINLV